MRRRAVAIVVAGLIATLLLPLALNVFKTEAAAHQTARLEIATALRDHWLDDDFGQLVDEALETIEGRFKTSRFSVNKPYDASVINVYVVRSDVYAGSAGRSRIFARSRQNFVSIAPDVVIIDSGYLNFITHEAITDLGARLEASSMTFSEPEKRRSIIGSRMLRVSNIDQFVTQGDVPGDLKLAAEYRRLAGYKDEESFISGELLNPQPLLENIYHVLFYNYAREHAAADSPVRFTDGITAALSSVLTFIMLHEVGHLEDGTDGGFLADEELDASASAASSPRTVVDREKAADRYAAEKLKDLTAAPALATNHFLFVGVSSTAQILEDTVVARLFRGFRGLDAQKFGSFIAYSRKADCRTSARGFFDFNLIDDIEPAVLPLVSVEELGALSQRADEFQAASHDSHMARSGLIASTVSDATIGALKVVSPAAERFYLNRRTSLEAILNRDRPKLADSYREFMKSTYGTLRGSIPFDDVFLLFQLAGMTTEEAAACPTVLCPLLVNEDLGIYFEAALDFDDTISFGRMTIRGLLPKDGEERNRAEADPAFMRRFERKFTLAMAWVNVLATFHNAAPEELELARQYVKDIAVCGFGSFDLSKARWRLRGSTLGNWKDISIEYFSKAEE